MKTLLIIVTLLGLFSFTETNQNTVETTEIQILPAEPIPRNVIQKPCKVWNHTDFITVDFLRQVGEVRIKIIDEVGATVVNEVVNSNTVESVRISTVQLPTGNYTLRLEMGQVFGGVYMGMFYK